MNEPVRTLAIFGRRPVFEGDEDENEDEDGVSFLATDRMDERFLIRTYE